MTDHPAMRVRASRTADDARQKPTGTRPGRSEWGLRKRSVVAAAVVVTLALLLGSAVLLWVLSTSLTTSAQTALGQRTNDIAQLVSSEELEDARSTLREDRRGNEVIQVLDSRGLVVLSTNRRLSEPISGLRPSPGRSARETIPRLAALNDDDEQLIAARGIKIEGKASVVLVSVPIQVQADSVQTVAWLLLAASPLAVGLVAAAVWILVGRSLRTVDRIRQQVAEIDAQRLHDRVGVPGTADEIAALATTMNQMLDKVEASDQGQRAFFSDASHELRSPLSTLVTTAEVASLDPTGQTWISLQNTVLAETRRMQGLVEGLLTLAKVDSQSLQMRCDDIDLEDVLGGEVHRLRSLTTLEVICDIAPVRIVGDEHRLTQVFRNLLDNAARHAKTTVRLTTQTASDALVVIIDNDGAVIDPADRERVFDRFVRLDDARSSDEGGSGLGLAIAREIVAAHGGKVTVEDADPAGWCRFVVRLPQTAQLPEVEGVSSASRR